MKIRYSSTLVFSICCALAGTLAVAQTASRINPPVESPAAFFNDLYQANLTEIEMGKAAQQKAQNSAVRDFAARMVKDHTNLNNNLKHVAAQNNMPLPTGLSAPLADQVNKVQNMSGKGFDRAYMDYMLSDHRALIGKVQMEAESSPDPVAKNLAGKTLPVLENHLRLAENVAGKLGMNPRKGMGSRSR